MRILVVEDEKKVASFIKRGLAEEGYAVDVAADGEEGLAMGREHVHDLLILDIRLPRMDGLQVLRALRQDRVMTPVLLLTVRATIDSDGVPRSSRPCCRSPISLWTRLDVR